MYTPKSFAESDRSALFDFIDVSRLGILVTMADGRLAGTHLPLILDRESGPMGTLAGHLARANPQSTPAASGTTAALIIFAGPDAYVTPEWYATKKETGRVVPTWNYVAVHAYGVLRFHDDRTFLRRHLEALTRRNEAGREIPWNVGDAPEDYIAAQAQMKAIVAITMEIEQLEGKWKMSQNRADADIAGVINGLNASPDSRDREVATIVSARRPAN